MDGTDSRMSSSARIAAVAAGVRACRPLTILIWRIAPVIIGIAAVPSVGSAVSTGTVRVHDGCFPAVLEFIEAATSNYFPGVHALQGRHISIGGAYRNGAHGGCIV